MLIVTSGKVQSSPDLYLGCTINIVGAMGAGNAKWYRDNVPGLYTWYRDKCRRMEIKPNELYEWKWGDKTIVLIPTKVHWKDRSPKKMVIENIYTLADYCDKNKIPAISIPPLGCGNGGLQLQDVLDVLNQCFQYSDTVLTVYV